MATITRGVPAPAEAKRKVRSRGGERRIWRTVGIYLVLILVCVIVLFPIYWMLTISFKTARDIYRAPSLFPAAPTLDNYRTLIDKKHFFVNIRNSLIVATSTTLVSMFIASLAAYSLVRMKYRLRGLIGKLILLSYLTPA